MTRMTGPDCVVMCNLINTHTHTHTHTHTPIKALARPPRSPWEEGPAGSPKHGKHGNEESYGKVQGSAGERRHGICGMPW